MCRDASRMCDDYFFVCAEDVVGSFESAADRLAATDFTKEVLETILTYAPLGSGGVCHDGMEEAL